MFQKYLQNEKNCQKYHKKRNNPQKLRLKTYLHEKEDIFTPTRKDESLMTQEEVNATQIQLFMVFPNWVRRQVLILKKK